MPHRRLTQHAPGLASLPAFQSRLCFPLTPRPLRETLVFSALFVPAVPPHATPRGTRTCVYGEDTEDFEFSTDVTSATPGLGEEAAGATLITIPFTLCEWRSCRCQGCLLQGAHDQSASLARPAPAWEATSLSLGTLQMEQTLCWF